MFTLNKKKGIWHTLKYLKIILVKEYFSYCNKSINFAIQMIDLQCIKDYILVLQEFVFLYMKSLWYFSHVLLWT